MDQAGIHLFNAASQNYHVCMGMKGKEMMDEVQNMSEIFTLFTHNEMFCNTYTSLEVMGALAPNCNTYEHV